MRSDGTEGEGRTWPARLRSQGLGFLCAQLTVLLLAVGSVVIARHRGGDAEGMQLDELGPFFDEPSVSHLWLYLLLPVMALYALNTALCTWHSVIQKWRAGVRTLSAYAPAMMHVAFLLAMVAHLVGGLRSEERGMIAVDGEWGELSEGLRARAVDLVTEEHPDGQPRSAVATVLIQGGGTASSQRVGFNEPLSLDFGRDLYFLVRYARTPQSATFRDGDLSCMVSPGQTCQLGETRWFLTGLYPEGHWGAVPVARLVGVGEGRPPGPDLLLSPDPTGSRAREGPRLVAVEERPLLLLRRRFAAGNPWALGAATVMVLGLVLMGRLWLAR